MSSFRKFTVEGVLVYGQGNQMIGKPYRATFVLPDQSIGHARSIIQKRLITGHLRDTVEFFKRWRTCQITNEQKASDKEIREIEVDPSKVLEMSASQLARLAINEQLEINPSLISNIEEARWQVEAALNKGKVVETEEEEEEEEDDEEKIENLDDEFTPQVNK